MENFQFSSVFQAWQMVAKLNNSLPNNHGRDCNEKNDTTALK